MYVWYINLIKRGTNYDDSFIRRTDLGLLFRSHNHLLSLVEPNAASKAILRLLKLQDVKVSTIESTRIFSTAVFQNQLIEAIEYWFDQTKLIFAEPVLLMQDHNLREAGIDVLIDLPVSKVKFGVQIKAPSDIEKDDL
jgi:hypothetical protein